MTFFHPRKKKNYFKKKFLKATKYELQLVHFMRIYKQQRVKLEVMLLIFFGTFLNATDRNSKGRTRCANEALSSLPACLRKESH